MIPYSVIDHFEEYQRDSEKYIEIKYHDELNKQKESILVIKSVVILDNLLKYIRDKLVSTQENLSLMVICIVKILIAKLLRDLK